MSNKWFAIINAILLVLVIAEGVYIFTSVDDGAVIAENTSDATEVEEVVVIAEVEPIEDPVIVEVAPVKVPVVIAEVEPVITIEESVEPEPEVSLDFELDTDEQAYTVKPGDTLRKIAENYYGDESQYPRIVMANSGTIVQATLIYPGQELTIPDQNDPTYYTVKSGDTLSDIAEAYNGD